jgi:hypothetical protein
VDRNPLRRRTDRIETAVRILLVLAFLIAGPMLAVSVGKLTYAAGLRQVKSDRSWQQVNAVLIRSTPLPYNSYGAMTTVWVPGRWRVPSGRARTGLVPAQEGTRAGQLVRVWVDHAGKMTGQQPVTVGVVVGRVVMAALGTVAGVGLTLMMLAGSVRWLLNRRRLARWGIEWALVGPRWTSRR